MLYILFFSKTGYTQKNRNDPEVVARDVLTKRSWDPKLGTLAGSRYYRDFWTRDCFFSSLGLLSIKEYDRVYHNLSTMKKYTRKDGLVPLRVGTYSHIPRFFLGVDLPGTMPIYHDDKHGTIPTDSNTQYIILVTEYIKHSNVDPPVELIQHCKKVYSYVKSSLMNKDDDLLYGKSFDSWHDSFDTNGACLFSNILWAQCQKSMMELFRNDRILYTECKMRYTRITNVIMKHYWTGNYLRIYPKMNNACSAGNALAIFYDIVDRRTSHKIIDWFSHNIHKNNIPAVPAIYPPLSSQHIHAPMRFIGLGDYHNRHIWPWVHYLFACACKRSGYYPEPIQNGSKRLEELMCYDSYERIDPKNLKPVTHFLQSSECGFSESAGMYTLYKQS